MKKLNKIYNYADLIHSENLLILSIIGSLLRESDKPEIEKCIKAYIQQRENIQKGKFELNKSGLVTYSHGEYFLLGRKLGTFGYSVKKEKKRNR